MFRAGILPTLRPRCRAGVPEKVVTSFLRVRLCGGRFTRGAVPLSLFGDISALGDLIAAAARLRFLAENPGRRRIPKGFTKDLRLAATGITEGSAVVEVALSDASSELPAMPRQHHRYYEGARADLLSTIRSASSEQGADGKPYALPAALLPHFDRIGRGLTAGESIRFDSTSEREEAFLTAEVRKRLLFSSSLTTSITEEMVLRGSVPEVDQGRSTFELQLIDGRKLSGPMPEPYLEAVLEAFGGYRNQVKIQMAVVGTLNRKQEVGGWQEIQDLSILDPLDIAAQLDELRALSDGWLDGDGLAPPPDGLDRLATHFENYYPEQLPLPSIYPTPTGGAQLEWTLGSNEISVEVDLMTGKADWHWVDVSSGDDTLDALDLDASRGWSILAERIERFASSSS